MKLILSIFLVLACWVPVTHGFFLFTLFNRMLYMIFRPSVSVSFALAFDNFEEIVPVADGKVYDLALNDISALTYRADLKGLMSGNLDRIAFNYTYTPTTGGTATSLTITNVDTEEPYLLSEESLPYFTTEGKHTLAVNALDSDFISMASKTITWTLTDSST
jgi:hypothetical protein